MKSSIIKVLFLSLGLFIAGATIAAVPGDHEKTKIESVVKTTIDAAVDMVEYVVIDNVPAECSANYLFVSNYVCTGGTEFETPGWKYPEKLSMIMKDAKRRTDLKLMSNKGKPKPQIFKRIQPPSRE